MQMQEIRAAAREMGLRPGKLRKADLIRTIQVQEGNFDCFGTAVDETCDQVACIWRDDCFSTARRKADSIIV